MQANYGEKEIESLLQKVKIFNKNIGTYQIFAITENFDYTIRLSNGRIVFRIEDLQDDEKDILTPDQLQEIANRFVFSSSEMNQDKQVNQQKTNSNVQASPQKKGIGKTISIITVVFIIFIIGFLVMNNTNSGYGSEDKTYREKVMTIEEIEHSQPTNFLFADGTYKENFWGDKIKVNCVIKNRATIASYKDATVRITYYTKTKTELGSKDYTIYEVFPPNSSKIVELKIDKYKNVDSIGWEVIGAIPY